MTAANQATTLRDGIMKHCYSAFVTNPAAA